MRVSQGKNYNNDDGVKLEMELVDLRAEKSVITMKLQALQQEKDKMSGDLDNVYTRHKEEMEIQQLGHFQVN